MSDLLSFPVVDKNDYADLIDRYQMHLYQSDYSKNTIKNYLASVRKLIAFLEVDLLMINETHIKLFKDELYHRLKMRATTTNRHLHVIRHFMGWLFDEKLINTDVSRKIKLLKRQKPITAPKGMVQREINLILQLAADTKKTIKDRNTTILNLMLNAGLRVGEVVALNIGDMQVNPRSGKMVIQGKGNKERKVMLNGRLRKALDEYLVYRKRYAPDCFAEADPLFLSERKLRLSIRSIQNMINNLAKRSKIERLNISPHTFRHTFGKNYYTTSKHDIVSLQGLMGHSSIDTTAIYSLPDEEQIELNLDKL
jgi:site-specific recombinase XerD